MQENRLSKATSEIRRLLDQSWDRRDTIRDGRTSTKLRLPYDFHYQLAGSVQYDNSDESISTDRRKQVHGDIEKVLEYILGHFAANPSRPGTVEALRTTYAFPTLPTSPSLASIQGAFRPPRTLELESFQPNRSETAASQYLKTLASAAQYARQLYCENVGATTSILTDASTEMFGRKKYLLLGEKGSGKTIFINYLITTHHTVLNDARVVWVRCDYTKDVPNGVSVETRLRWQLCRVLALYYDAARFRADKAMAEQSPEYLDQILGHWREKLDANLVFEINGQNEKFFARACAHDPSLTKEKFSSEADKYVRQLRIERTYREVPIWFSKGLFDWLAIDEKVGFLAVLDGLDQIGLTADDKESYAKRVDDLKVIANEKYYEMTYLITMRHHTFITNLTGKLFTTTFVVHKLAQVSANDIWNSKLKLLEKPVPRTLGADSLSALETNLYSSCLKEVCQIFAGLVAHSLTLSTSSRDPTKRARQVATVDLEHGFEILERLFGTDRRALFRALARISKFLFRHHSVFFERTIDHILALSERSGDGISAMLPDRSLLDAEGIRRYHYLVIEALFLRTPTSDFCVPGYQFHWDRENKLKILRSGQSEHTLYNLFHHPFRANLPQCIELLMGVRILQFLRFNSDTPAPEVVSFLQNAFGYQKDTLCGKIELLTEASLIEYRVTLGGNEDDLAITDQGCFYLDRLLHSVEYLSLACHALPLPERIVQRCFPIHAYGDVKSIAFNKFVCVINLCRIISGVENDEETAFNIFSGNNLDKRYGSFNSFRNDRHKTFSISSRINTEVEATLQRMLISAEHSYPDGYREMLSTLNPAAAHWHL